MTIVLSILVYIVYVLTIKENQYIFTLINEKIKCSEVKYVKRRENGI